jgi:hypothetical protein
MLRGYCLNILQSHRNLKRAVGIDIDASSKVTGRTGGSRGSSCAEDLQIGRTRVENRGRLPVSDRAPGPAYDEYRKRRRLMLRGYCLNILQSHRNLKRAVGIGIDASSKVTGRTGGSEDFYALEVDQWTPELDEQAEELKKDLRLLEPENVTRGTDSVDEFPRAEGTTLVRDPDWPNMWRLRRPNGQLTDMVNLTRAKDAARSFSRRDTDA